MLGFHAAKSMLASKLSQTSDPIAKSALSRLLNKVSKLEPEPKGELRHEMSQAAERSEATVSSQPSPGLSLGPGR